MNTYQIGQRVTLLSQHVATVMEYSEKSGKYRLSVDGWMREHRGKVCEYWYGSEHISPLFAESDLKPVTKSVFKKTASISKADAALLGRIADKKPQPLSSSVPGPDDPQYEPLPIRAAYHSPYLLQSVRTPAQARVDRAREAARWQSRVVL